MIFSACQFFLFISQIADFSEGEGDQRSSARLGKSTDRRRALNETKAPIVSDPSTISPKTDGTMSPIVKERTHTPKTQSPRRRRLEGTKAPVGSGGNTYAPKTDGTMAPIVQEGTHALATNPITRSETNNG